MKDKRVSSIPLACAIHLISLQSNEIHDNKRSNHKQQATADNKTQEPTTDNIQALRKTTSKQEQNQQTTNEPTNRRSSKLKTIQPKKRKPPTTQTNHQTDQRPHSEPQRRSVTAINTGGRVPKVTMTEHPKASLVVQDIDFDDEATMLQCVVSCCF